MKICTANLTYKIKRARLRIISKSKNYIIAYQSKIFLSWSTTTLQWYRTFIKQELSINRPIQIFVRMRLTNLFTNLCPMAFFFTFGKITLTSWFFLSFLFVTSTNLCLAKKGGLGFTSTNLLTNLFTNFLTNLLTNYQFVQATPEVTPIQTPSYKALYVKLTKFFLCFLFYFR